MIVDSQPREFTFPDYIGNFIEDKVRMQTYFNIDKTLYQEISIDKNVCQLKKVECVCDYYLEHGSLDDETITKVLNLRDFVIMRIQNLEREFRLLEYIKLHNRSQTMRGYSHCMQSLLPPEIQLTDEEKETGYIPQKGEPIEYECGCLHMRYYVPCDCNYVSKCEIKFCGDIFCNERKYPEIKCAYMCKKHKLLSEGKEMLETELLKIKKELSSINYFNSLDYKNIRAKMLYPRNKIISSRFPWKNDL